MKPIVMFTGYTRKDWTTFVDWVVPAWSYTKTQKRHRLNFPAIYDKDDKYIDKRTRFKKIRVKVIVEEI